MGNAQAATLSTEEAGKVDSHTDVLHFEHTITGRLVTDIHSAVPVSPRHMNLSDPGLGEGKVVKITLAGDKIILEDGDVVLGRSKYPPILETSFGNVKELCWDHSHSSLKIVVAGPPKALSPNASSRAPNLSLPGASTSNQYILIVNNSLQLEQEVKVRLNVLRKLASDKRNISFQYIGMFAGPTKPKPFQRKRANLSKLKQGQLPSLPSMKQYATSQYHGAAQPVQTAQSRRLDLALQHIHEGFVSFAVLRASHSPTQETSTLMIDYDGVKYCNDLAQGPTLTLPLRSIEKWEAIDQFVPGSSDNGLRIVTQQGATYFFQIKHSWDVKHAMEYFWNQMLFEEEDADPFPSSTHGRIVEELYTLTGSVNRPPKPFGNLRIMDANGRLVCDLDPATSARRGSMGGATVPASASEGGHVRRNSLTSGRRGSFSSKSTALERTSIKAFWKKVVMHQGWLLKRGGATKKWLKRYFVLYNTCMGHILCYYGDHTETALFSDLSRERNVIDCSKVEFIRPVSNNPETPDFAFDIQSIMRDWTVCAADQNDLQTWLKNISYAVDADVGILPDDEAAFLVKPRQDPTMKLYIDEYSTFLRIHSWGVTVEALEGESRHRVFFWPYTDLYKWSILSQKGKIALQLTVFSNAEYTQKIDFIFRTRDAPRIASVIEYYIEKFMCVMHLRLELSGGDLSTNSSSHSPSHARRASNSHQPLPPKSPLFRKPTDTDWDDDHEEVEGGDEANWASDGEDDNAKQEDFLNFDVEETVEAQRRASFGSPVPTAVGLSSPVSMSGAGFSSSPKVASSSSSPPPPLAPPVQYVAKGISISTLARMEAWNKSLVMASQGLLFENKQVQVLLRHEYQQHQGSIALMLKNVGGLPLEGLTSNATSTTPGILVQSTPVEPGLMPCESTTQQIRVICMEPFQVAPSLTLEFTTPDSPTVHSKHTYVIPLPVSVLHFLSPLDFDRATFMQQWQNITVPEVLEAFPSTKPPVQADAITALLTNPLVKLGVVRELTMRNDSLQLLTFACSLETGTLSPQGTKLRVGALVRLEVSLQASAFRLTVRAVHPAAATALFRAIRQQLTTV